VLRRRAGRCYPLRALGAGDAGGSPSQPSEGTPHCASREAASATSSRSRLVCFDSTLRPLRAVN